MTDREITDDPFVVGLFGGSPKTETYASETYIDGITVRASRSGLVTSLSAPETKSSSEAKKVTRRSRGGSRNSGATDKRALNAAYSETRDRTSRRSLSDRLTLPLIFAGLVCGISPSSTRKQSGQPILVLALDMPGGSDAGKQRAVSSFSNGLSHRANRRTE